MAGGRVYTPLTIRLRAAALCLAVLLVTLMGWPRRTGDPVPAASRSGRLLIENAAPHAAVAGTASAAASATAAQPVAAAGPLGTGVASAAATTATALTPVPSSDPVAAASSQAPVRPPVEAGKSNPAAPTKPPVDEGIRPTSKLSPAAQALLAEAAKSVSLADDQVKKGRRKKETRRAKKKKKQARWGPRLLQRPSSPRLSRPAPWHT